jgi:hypothetical protein
MKRKFFALQGRSQESRQVSLAMQQLCQQRSPSPLCRQHVR